MENNEDKVLDAAKFALAVMLSSLVNGEVGPGSASAIGLAIKMLIESIEEKTGASIKAKELGEWAQKIVLIEAMKRQSEFMEKIIKMMEEVESETEVKLDDDIWPLDDLLKGE